MYENAVFTEHALEQMQRRGIPEDIVLGVLADPESIDDVRPGRAVVQGLVTLGENNRQYLLRVFVDSDRTPAEIVTIYRTSKIAKYRRTM